MFKHNHYQSRCRFGDQDRQPEPIDEISDQSLNSLDLGDLQEMLGVMGMREPSQIGSLDLNDHSEENSEIDKERMFTVKLESIKDYIQNFKGSSKIEGLLIRKCKNLVRCVALYQTTQLEHYSLLFEILLAACGHFANNESSLGEIETATTKISHKESFLPSRRCLEVIFLLIRAKLSGSEAREKCVKRIKELWKEDKSKRLVEFTLSIADSHLSEIRGEFRNLNITAPNQSIPQIVQSQSQEVMAAKPVKESPKKQQQHPTIQKKSLVSHVVPTQRQRQATILLPQSPIEILEWAIKQLESNPSSNPHAYHMIKTIPLHAIRKVPESKHLLSQVLELSFNHLNLMEDSLDKTVYLFQVEEFVDKLKSLFSIHKDSQSIIKAKKIVRQKIKDFCGKDATYYCSKIFGQSK